MPVRDKPLIQARAKFSTRFGLHQLTRHFGTENNPPFRGRFRAAVILFVTRLGRKQNDLFFRLDEHLVGENDVLMHTPRDKTFHAIPTMSRSSFGLLCPRPKGPGNFNRAFQSFWILCGRILKMIQLIQSEASTAVNLPPAGKMSAGFFNHCFSSSI
jgi:hypothetical protein